MPETPKPCSADELDEKMSHDWFDGYELDRDRVYATAEHLRSLEARIANYEKPISDEEATEAMRVLALGGIALEYKRILREFLDRRRTEGENGNG